MKLPQCLRVLCKNDQVFNKFWIEKRELITGDNKLSGLGYHRGESSRTLVVIDYIVIWR